MCRNIRPLFNFEPPATDAQVRAASLQYVRKISGFTKPSTANTEAFEAAIDEIAHASAKLLASLKTVSAPKDWQLDSARMRARSARRFGVAASQPE